MAHSKKLIVEEIAKKFESNQEFFQAAQAMGRYQKIHNLIREDYLVLLDLTERQKDDEVKFNALYRAALKGFFSLIEADIYGLNQLDQYPKYSDQHRFDDKFKKTFTQVCKTWKKPEIRKAYFDTKFQNLKVLRVKRDELIHPKNVEHIHLATKDSFKQLQDNFNDYDNFIKALMSNFFIETQFSLNDLFRRK